MKRQKRNEANTTTNTEPAHQQPTYSTMSSVPTLPPRKKAFKMHKAAGKTSPRATHTSTTKAPPTPYQVLSRSSPSHLTSRPSSPNPPVFVSSAPGAP